MMLYVPIYTKKGNSGGVGILNSSANRIFMFLTITEENLLMELIKDAEPNKRLILRGIISRFSMPKECI